VFTKNVSGHNSAQQRKESFDGSAIPQYVVDAEKRLVWVTYPRKVTLPDIERYVATLQADPLFDPNFSEILDLTNVEEINLSGEELVLLADKIDPFSDSRRAFVVRNAIQKHAARMHKLLRGSPNISIFESIEEALKWIAA
jgi:hypothetical protein